MKQSPERRSLALAARHRGGDGAVQGKRFESPSGPATLGSTAEADLLLRTWYRDCRHAVDVDPAGQAERYGTSLPVPEWASRLVCSPCGSRAVDFVVAPWHTGGLGAE
jgi:hypothetical protein